MKKLKFPDNFYWGTATAAEQIEANGIDDKNLPNSVWAHWYKQDKHSFHKQKFTVNNFYEKYEDDLKIASDLNMNSMRISFSWARIMPSNGVVDESAIEYYKDVLKEMKKNNLKVFATILHWEIPMWVQEEGPLHTKEFLKFYEEYFNVLFDNFGEDVEVWATFNEAIAMSKGQYLQLDMYPNKMSFTNSIKATWTMGVAHHLAVKEHSRRELSSEIGTILNITPFIPRSDEKGDLEAAMYADQLYWKCFIDPILKGEYPKELKAKLEEKGLWPKDFILSEELELIKEFGGHYIGVNYYRPQRAMAIPYEPNWDAPVLPWTHFYNVHDKDGVRMNPYRGWEIKPEVLYDLLMSIKEDYGNVKTYITENGMGVEGEDIYRDETGQIQDSYRIDFITEHLLWVHKAIEDGANCNGYHMWTYIDNWSWTNAYKNRYGFIELDIETGERKPKKSASWAKDLFATGELKITKEF